MGEVVNIGYWLVAIIGTIVCIGFAMLAYVDWRAGRLSAPMALIWAGMVLTWGGDAGSRMWYGIWRALNKPDWMIDHPVVLAVTWMVVAGGCCHLASWWQRYRGR